MSVGGSHSDENIFMSTRNKMPIYNGSTAVVRPLREAVYTIAALNTTVPQFLSKYNACITTNHISSTIFHFKKIYISNPEKWPGHGRTGQSANVALA